MTLQLSMILSGLVFSSVPSNAETFHYIALGDSITAGFLGYTQVRRDDPIQTFSLNQKSKLTDGFEEPPPPHSLLGLRYARILESKKRWSYASGRNSYGVSSRLFDWLSDHEQNLSLLRIHNMAESGALSNRMPAQARKAMSQIPRRERSKIKLITIFFGSNDACEALDPFTGLDVIQSSFRRTFDELATQITVKTPVLVSSIPNIPMLNESSVLNHRAFLGMSCRDIRRIVNFCKPMFNISSANEQAQAYERVQQINATIETEILSARKKYPQLDLVYSRSVYDYPITGGFLAADCFHPGKRGQPKIAEILWADQPWYKNQTDWTPALATYP